MTRKRILRLCEAVRPGRGVPEASAPAPRATLAEQLPYERREALLSRGELAFYRALRFAIATEHGISIKTRLADVVRCPPELWDTIHGRRLSQKHVDFVIYDRYTAAIVAVVELDDQSHRAKDRRKRDAFVDDVLRCAGVEIVRVRAASKYDADALRLSSESKQLAADRCPCAQTVEHFPAAGQTHLVPRRIFNHFRSLRPR